jgi:molybdopterin-biosynthesis enzyme MoeA-like protein
MKFGTVIIGDELLSGKREDRHFRQVIAALQQRGLELHWCSIVGDDPQLIVRTLRHTLSSTDVVFCFGGIGATPDDHTRQCAAQAAGVALYRHPDAVAEIEARFGAAAYPRRVLMAELPQGSRIVPNPVNRIPGFSLAQHHFLPGFPEMAWPMMKWVLDHEYAGLQPRAPQVERAIVVGGAHESDLLEILHAFVERFPALRLSSLPSLGPPRRIELAVRGDPREVAPAMAHLQEALTEHGHHWREADQ